MDIEQKRRRNEHKFDSWQLLSAGGRRYILTVPGHHGWSANYVKEVDKSENTLRFYQEIYNNNGKLVEIHEKYPEDTGHRKV